MKQSTRFCLIEACLLRHGLVRRRHICEGFDINLASATRLFNQYREQHPGNISYDPTVKAYIKADAFVPSQLAELMCGEGSPASDGAALLMAKDYLDSFRTVTGIDLN
ncbi:hypothetical protein [Gallaecimonas xiamenensis]|uniref:DNA-binding transcriptional repressor CapW winged helix-turn-helix domain-containing protein n=1 Tax=Gallaecimonas xiamenensis 3-C-1 TaxID=745411 RepID=K2JLE2_9GAMM|nr:hypothetical protein [Gallaecimonas xiamenensis]EKE75212.1 hypothetical protein B3C1_08046 [Gallaecimonas xiamenensis 3-C-1]